MKTFKTIAIILVLILIGINAKSQYKPLLLNQYKWNVNVSNQGNNITEQYRVDADTIMFNQIWKKIKMISTQNPNFINKFFLREDTITKKIYAMNPGQAPHLYFDFDANINDTLLLYNLIYNEIDTFLVFNKSLIMTCDSIYRNSLRISNISHLFSFEIWIEGVGSTNGLYYGNKLQYLNSIVTRLEASCYNNQLVYNGGDLEFNYCSFNIGINETEINSTKIYPNPASDYIYIENIKEKARIEIYNMSGIIQLTADANGDSNINIRNLPDGLYLIKIQTDSNIAIKKLLKQ